MNVDMSGKWNLIRMDFLMDVGCPPCPRCHSGVGVSSADYGDFKCLSCGNIFRRYGNGGLHFGMMPRCPECGGFTEELV